ncbi:MAG: Sec-dependent nitrous-oxide reductase [Deltaproteobacteria bacterium]|nr:Sec-dependent nitrous-oxide reductase [Deltaproteobacteria bacterium]
MFKKSIFLILLMAIALGGCGKGQKTPGDVLDSNAAQKVYVAPGQKDEFYWFMSGGFSGQVAVYGIPSGRLFKQIPVFSQFPESGYGYDEETKNLLMTSHGFIPWDDAHHTEISLTKGLMDGRWLFINGNNTPRIARIDLADFKTAEILEIPNSSGNHASPFLTENTEYLMAATRFSVPYPQRDIPVESAAEGEFKGTITMVKVDPKTGAMNIDLQVLVPGYNYDIVHCGKGPSKDWCFFSTYNTEQAYKMLEIEASKNDKDYLLAFNWALAKQCLDQGKAKEVPASYYRNVHPENRHAVSERLTSVKMLHPDDCPGMMYFLPTPKSPHGVDVDPTGEYIVAGGKLATVIPVHSFSKLAKAIKDKSQVLKIIDGIPVLNYEATLAGEVEKPCLGPLHTEFDSRGYAYTSCFISSEVIKWKLGEWKVVDRVPAYYSIGHLSIAGGDSAKPYDKYLIALNKITKDRYLPTGPEVTQSAQLYDISGAKMKLLLDFPTIGEPHYAQGIPASMLMDKSRKIYPLEKNEHPFAAKNEKEARVVRNGKTLHVYMTSIRSHFKPDIVEAKVGDTVLFHVTNLEQDYDIAHGFAVFGAAQPNLLLMPGETKTLRFDAKKEGIYPFYCTDFCSALHQEMQQYLRVSK